MVVAIVATAVGTNGSGTSKTVASPSTNAAHKLSAVVMIEDVSDIASRTITPSNGAGTWTLIGRVNAANGTCAAALYVGLGGYTTTFTIDTAIWGQVVVYAHSGAELGTAVDAFVTTTVAANNTHTLGSLTTAADNSMVMAVAYFVEWWTGKSSAAFNTEVSEDDALGMYYHSTLKTPAGAFGAASVVKAGGTAASSVGIIFSIAPPAAAGDPEILLIDGGKLLHGGLLLRGGLVRA